MDFAKFLSMLLRFILRLDYLHGIVFICSGIRIILLLICVVCLGLCVHRVYGMSMRVYTRDQLLSFRAGSPSLPRCVRKTLFNNHIWLPSYKRSLYTHETGSSRPDQSTFTNHLSVPPPIPTQYKHNRMSIGYMNAQSIRAKSAQLTNVISEHRLDIFAITETWHESTDDITLKQITPDGYSSIDCARHRSPSSDPDSQLAAEPRSFSRIQSSVKKWNSS